MEEKEKVSNVTHPELRAGEIYLCALFREEDFNSIPHTTKRKGVKAYNFLGEHMKGCFPVFVQKEEEEIMAPIRKKMIDELRGKKQ